jgi:hypothetical protein
MRKTHFKGHDRTFNLDWIDDKWLWLYEPEPIIEELHSWSEQDILHICECLLEDSLRNLFDGRCSLETAIEIYKWMTDIKDPNPFSFINCCKLTGIDPEEVRDSIIFRLQKTRRLSLLH